MSPFAEWGASIPADTSVPADVSTYAFPFGTSGLMVIGAIFCAALVVSSILLQITQPSPASPVVMLLAIALFGPAAAYCVKGFSRMRASIAVDNRGIWYVPRNAPFTYIAWSDVAHVEAHDTMQRLILVDSTGTRRMNLEYQLSNFDQLRAFILSHVLPEIRLTGAAINLFHRSWINKAILLAVAGICLYIPNATWRPDQTTQDLIFVWVGIASLLGFIRDPTTLRITSDAIIIGYVGWRRTIAFNKVKEITLTNVTNRGNVWPVVTIIPNKGRKMKLFRFKEGSIALNDALQTAWKLSRGGS